LLISISEEMLCSKEGRSTTASLKIKERIICIWEDVVSLKLYQISQLV